MNLTLSPENSTTKVVADLGSLRMTGDENYPLIGDIPTAGIPKEIFQEKVECLQKEFQGLYLYGDCLRKNKIAKPYLEALFNVKMRLVIGAMRVWSADQSSCYGFDCHPEKHEFHAWLEDGQFIYDIALPGVILRGTNTSDEVGPYLVGRSPVILMGSPPTWLTYKRVYYFEQI